MSVQMAEEKNKRNYWWPLDHRQKVSLSFRTPMWATSTEAQGTA